jgi:outer membrane receptor for ferrienterochelin and colicin
MKRHFIFALQFTFVIGLISCGSTQNTSDTQKSRGPDYSRYTNLADIIRLQPGVVVQGIGNNVTITIRGINSIQLDTRPLFVIDNVRIGHDYASANQAINTANVRSVRILKSLVETNSYGEDGRNGVIIIRSKTAPNIP